MMRLTETLVCEAGGQKVAFPLDLVERVVPAVALTPVPGAPPHRPGLINVHGEVRPLFLVRVLLGLPAREQDPDDQIVLARTAQGGVALWVDQVQGVRSGEDRSILQVENLERFLAGAGGGLATKGGT
jgi:purine-binding chemotaxis protein CheW